MRLDALAKLKTVDNYILITNIAGISKYLPKPSVFYNYIINIKIGDKLDYNEFKLSLTKAGYKRVPHVDSSLQFAARGDIIDLYPINLPNPIRIEFFDNIIESIRNFNISDQRSTNTLEEAIIMTASDFILSEDEYRQASNKILSKLEKLQTSLNLTNFSNLKNFVESDVSDLLEFNYSPRLAKYYSLIANTCTIFDYVPNAQLLLIDYDGLINSAEMINNDANDLLKQQINQYRCLPGLSILENPLKLIRSKENNALIFTTIPKDLSSHIFKISNVPYGARNLSDADKVIKSFLNDSYSIIININSAEQYTLITELLTKQNINYEKHEPFVLPNKYKIAISLYSMPLGFVIKEAKVAVLTAKELFDDKVNHYRYDSRYKKATIIKSQDDLQIGDYIVHEYQGIARYLGIENRETEGVHSDYVKLEFAHSDLLYIPIEHFELIRKYQGREGVAPKLSRLHSKDWENTKKKIKERVDDLSNRLFNLYSERNNIKGFAFQKDDELQKDFENKCDFILTPDQEKAVKEIKSDMESDRPMDRLLCGDVGFGKTEVAFRAIFKAILSGKQVALLCPTTLLARQHFERAQKRFSGFDVKIAMFSRLTSQKDLKDYESGLADGSVHLAIGTHKLLSKQIQFKDLGLLVIDEEQRFGVEQKERLTELKTNIDVLSLSATPIPRTLQISLLGVRSFSQINTAPVDRMPIQTYVLPYSSTTVKQLIERELGRDGQVFYMHNNVQSLYSCAKKLSKMLPGVSIGVVHGQMEKNDIEDVMLAFYNNEIKVLVCTSIIENGIDIPNANLVIVEDSINYGLSQLYQIKGRVGRSDRIAYAYLMYPENMVLKEEAAKRLKAIKDFTELGSGYKIAQRDLMIRGAGDILGPDQAGFIDSIGLEMYIKLLNEAVNVKKGIAPEPKKSDSIYLSIKLDAYIPKSFAGDSDKMRLYQDITSCSSVESLAALKLKTIDIFGHLPENVDLLFKKRKINLLINETGITSAKENANNIEITFGEPYINYRGIGNLLFESLIPYLSKIKVTYKNHHFVLTISKTDSLLDDVEGILSVLLRIQNTNSVMEVV